VFVVKVWIAKLILAVALVVALASPPARCEERTTDAFMKNARQLTYEGVRSGESYFSPDGKFLIFQSEREEGNPFYQIYILSFETGDIHRVSPGTGKTTCSFFRPGTDRVEFASTHLDPDAVKKQKEEIEFRASGQERRYAWDYDEYFDIFSCARDGSDLVRLTDAEGYDAEGGYSPDGSQIVFSSMRAAYPVATLSDEQKHIVEMNPSYFAEIYIMNADGSDQKRLTDWPGYDGGPFFSPDGTHIVWRHFTEDGLMADVYTMNLDGSGRHRITNFGSMCWAPFFHPSGDYVIFTSNKLGFDNFELFIVAANGATEPVRVTYTDRFDGLPVFSPDGKRLVWTSTRTANHKSQIFIADWDNDAALEAIHKSPARTLDKDEANGGTSGDNGDKSGMLAPVRDGARTAREAVAGYSAGDGATNGGSLSIDITAADLRARAASIAGEKKPGEALGSCFESLGLVPMGDKKGYFQKTGGKKGARNVVALVPAGNDDADAPVLVIGSGDASGAATLMELAAALKARRDAEPGKFTGGVVLVAWSSGNDAMSGSSYFVEHPPVDWSRVTACVILDGVGHLRDNTLALQGTGSSPRWTGIFERRNVVAGFNLEISDTPDLPEGAAAFYAKHVPVVSLSTSGEDGDVDYDGMERVAKLALAVAMDVAGSGERLQYAEIERPVHGGGGPETSLRAYLGTVPDYAGGDGVEGCLLTGVREGSPADKAGLQAGDVIVEFAGKAIKNIYDYSNALDGVKVGVPVKVVVMRGGEKMEMSVTPEARH
jgi:Tol biopolymer transport system component